MKKRKQYPIVDLFAGPGGLGEGFAGLTEESKAVFKSILSIEREKYAHQTLLLRHFYRSFDKGKVPESYYDYLDSNLSKEELIKHHKKQWNKAEAEVLDISLGRKNHDKVKDEIHQRLGETNKWALLGGPPCQAYSLAGRSRMKGDKKFEKDIRHFLYKEYLKIIVDHRPPVFVMENVKGLLSARVKGKLVITKIIKDLSNPGRAVRGNHAPLKYRLYSLSRSGAIGKDMDPKNFVVKAEEHGIPQARHRVFILGVRSDVDVEPSVLEKGRICPTVKNVLFSMPKIRSGVSKQQDSVKLWKHVLTSAKKLDWNPSNRKDKKLLKTEIELAIEQIQASNLERSSKRYVRPRSKWVRKWYYDKRLKSITSHESRSHMESDLHRYLYASSYSLAFDVSPKLADFPYTLLPAHKNAGADREKEMFSDRFRVQIQSRASTTITSHISKDGHYFIHYDPTQCRSLTVREAARLQTFPDNYYFEGPRTSQYHQVGNAVPPYLAYQIAEIVKDILDQIPED